MSTVDYCLTIKGVLQHLVPQVLVDLVLAVETLAMRLHQ